MTCGRLVASLSRALHVHVDGRGDGARVGNFTGRRAIGIPRLGAGKGPLMRLAPPPNPGKIPLFVALGGAFRGPMAPDCASSATARVSAPGKVYIRGLIGSWGGKGDVMDLDTTLGLIKSCLDNVSAIKSLFTREQEPDEINLIQRQLVETSSQLIQIQKNQMALLQENAKLQQALKEKEQWENESKRYELYKARTGDLVYVLKQDEANNQPIHAICTQCYENGIKSILQRGHSSVWGSIGPSLDCNRCDKQACIGIDERFAMGLVEKKDAPSP